MKILIGVLVFAISFNLLAVEKVKAKKKKKEVAPIVKAPCDTKEDILKKLEEEKKKQKPFSLQGGNTGCSVDAK